MSDQLESRKRESIVEPERRRARDPRTILLGLVLATLTTLAAAVLTIVLRAGGSGTSQANPPVSLSRPTAARGGAPRLVAIRALLRRRSAAVRHHDRAAFLSTVDPAEVGFWRQQSHMIADLGPVKFASWSYGMGPRSAGPDNGRLERYGAPAWAPAEFVLHYRIAGFDTSPTDLHQYPTFVDRSGRWYLASLSDFRWRGEISATDLWDYAPVRVVRLRSVLVLGPQSQIGTMIEVADQVQASIPKVTAVWGPDWSRRVVVQVPSSQHEMALLVADPGDLNQIAAVTSAEVAPTAGRPKPVGDRVTVNPRNWSTLGPVGAAIVITHELTHVASREDTGSQTPKWLAEGFADYVGFRDSGVPVRSAAAELAKTVRAGRIPRRLPTNADFDGNARRLPQAYEVSWLACRYIAKRFGQPALVRFYRSVGTSRRTTASAVSHALHHVLGLTPGQFTSRWRAYVLAELAR